VLLVDLGSNKENLDIHVFIFSVSLQLSEVAHKNIVIHH
jgi:hypothetical protein